MIVIILQDILLKCKYLDYTLSHLFFESEGCGIVLAEEGTARGRFHGWSEPYRNKWGARAQSIFGISFSNSKLEKNYVVFSSHMVSDSGSLQGAVSHFLQKKRAEEQQNTHCKYFNLSGIFTFTLN